MGLRVNNNIAALNAYRNLAVTDGQMSKSLEKLSSGFRINRAADDAAGLAISEGLRSQIGGLTVAVRNTQDGISVVQTAEGALTETHSILQRMRDLSVQGSNAGGLNSDALSNIQSEISQLKAELNRIAGATTFNGKKLLDGSYQAVFQVGANAGETISVGIGSVGNGMDAAGLKVDGIDVTGVGAYAFQTGTAPAAGKAVVSTAATAAAAAVMTIQEAASGTDFSTGTGTVASYESLSGTIGFAGKTLDLGSVDYSTATDGTTALAALNKAAQSAFGLPAGTNPFAGSATGITFTVPAVAIAGYTTASGFALSGSAGDIAKATPTFAAASGADAAIAVLDTAIKKVSTTRADLGAIQNRFDHTINNLNVAVENLTASESRIRDADMAQEMVQFTRNQILSQAGTAMLAQANQASQGVLQLLQR
jgi:flagellin-like hook-associated protein FlgL